MRTAKVERDDPWLERAETMVAFQAAASSVGSLNASRSVSTVDLKEDEANALTREDPV